MTKPFILNLTKVDRNSVQVVGGKGANLGELISNRFSVPSGFCVSVDAYKYFIIENDLQDRINQITDEIQWKDPTNIETNSAKIRELILQSSLSLVLGDEILKAYHQIDSVRNGNSYVAVRSSATAEDLPNASFAGQQETFLYVKEKELLHYLKSCWASLWTARAMAYRNKKEFEHNKVFISVVVQEMVDATVSGIMFTNNPLTHNENEIYVTSSFGLGELVVSGQVTPDSFIINKKNNKVTYKELGPKEKELVIGTIERTVLLDVAKNRRQEFSLTKEQLQELGLLAIKVENHFEFPQDIEWSFANGKLYLLQSRPITTLAKIEEVDFGKITTTQIKILDDLLEHYPEAPTPLDYSLVTMSYQSLLDRGEELGISLSRATEIIQIDKEGKVRLHPPKIKFKWKLFSLLPKLVKASKDNDKPWQEIELEFHSFVEKMRTLKVGKLSNQSLIDEIDHLFNLAKKVNDLRFYFIVDSTLVSLLALSTIVKMFTKKKQRPIISDIITTNLNYKTSVIDKELFQLARQVSENVEVKSFILEGEYKNIADFKTKLLSMKDGNQLWTELQLFLNQYGFRTEKMYQPFISKSWLDDQMYFLDIFKAVLNDRQLFERKNKEQARNGKHQLWLSEFENKLNWPFKNLFKSSYQKLRKIYLYREETVFFIEVLFHYGRKLINELAVRLENDRVIENSKDIIYILREELAEIALETSDKGWVSELIRKRKDNMPKNQKDWKQSISQLSRKTDDNDSVIKGVSGSNGIAKGPVRIITKVADFKKLKQGEILVCQYTDPAWTPLFGIAAAIVADTGSPLSHAAIVAREYEIPAVLGTKIGTTSLEDGEIIVVDGTAGKVIRNDFKNNQFVEK